MWVPAEHHAWGVGFDNCVSVARQISLRTRTKDKKKEPIKAPWSWSSSHFPHWGKVVGGTRIELVTPTMSRQSERAPNEAERGS
jgi:hypothetical protein